MSMTVDQRPNNANIHGAFEQLMFTKGEGGEDIIAKKWGWYVIIHTLAGGDPLKITAATEIEIESAFTYLAYEQDKSRQGKSPVASQYR